MELSYKKLTEKIIGAAREVHRQLGLGFIESMGNHNVAETFRFQKRRFDGDLSPEATLMLHFRPASGGKVSSVLLKQNRKPRG